MARSAEDERYIAWLEARLRVYEKWEKSLASLARVPPDMPPPYKPTRSIPSTSTSLNAVPTLPSLRNVQLSRPIASSSSSHPLPLIDRTDYSPLRDSSFGKRMPTTLDRDDQPSSSRRSEAGPCKKQKLVESSTRDLEGNEDLAKTSERTKRKKKETTPARPIPWRTARSSLPFTPSSAPPAPPPSPTTPKPPTLPPSTSRLPMDLSPPPSPPSASFAALQARIAKNSDAYDERQTKKQRAVNIRDLVAISREAADLALGPEGVLRRDEETRRVRLEEERRDWEGPNEDEVREMRVKEREYFRRMDL